MRKRLIVSMVSLCLIVSLSVPVTATAGNVMIKKQSQAMPRWTDGVTISSEMQLEGKTVSCSSTVFGKLGTIKIVATYRLYQISTNGSATLLKTFPTVTSNTSTLIFSGKGTGTSGNTYRLEVTADCTRNGTMETITSYFDKKF